MSVSPRHSLARVLGDERRAHLMTELQRAPEGLDVQELSRRLGLHPNTVRWHLGVLEDAGAVASEPVHRTTRGRPRIVYRPCAEAVEGTRDEYRLLATILTGTLARHEHGPADAEASGYAWGRYLMPRPPPLTELTDEQATAAIVGLLDEQGFAPTASTEAIEMHRCPFHDLAESEPEIVCAVHKGLIDGALEELGSELRVSGLDVFVAPDLCVARLGRRL